MHSQDKRLQFFGMLLNVLVFVVIPLVLVAGFVWMFVSPGPSSFGYADPALVALRPENPTAGATYALTGIVVAGLLVLMFFGRDRS